jgi:hypothetical protein
VVSTRASARTLTPGRITTISSTAVQIVGARASLAKRRIGVLHPEPGAADELAQMLRERGAQVAVLDLDPALIARAESLDPEVIIVDPRHLDQHCWTALAGILKHPQLRWTCVIVSSAAAVAQQGHETHDITGLCAQVQLSTGDYDAAVARSRTSSDLEVQLETLGPARMLRLLVDSGKSWRARFTTKALVMEVDVSDGIIVGARGGRGRTIDESLLGSPAINVLLRETAGSVRARVVERPAVTNIMAPLDTAFAAALHGREDGSAAAHSSAHMSEPSTGVSGLRSLRGRTLLGTPAAPPSASVEIPANDVEPDATLTLAEVSRHGDDDDHDRDRVRKFSRSSLLPIDPAAAAARRPSSASLSAVDAPAGASTEQRARAPALLAPPARPEPPSPAPQAEKRESLPLPPSKPGALPPLTGLSRKSISRASLPTSLEPSSAKTTPLQTQSAPEKPPATPSLHTRQVLAAADTLLPGDVQGVGALSSGPHAPAEQIVDPAPAQSLAPASPESATPPKCAGFRYAKHAAFAATATLVAIGMFALAGPSPTPAPAKPAVSQPVLVGSAAPANGSPASATIAEPPAKQVTPVDVKASAPALVATSHVDAQPEPRVSDERERENAEPASARPAAERARMRRANALSNEGASLLRKGQVARAKTRYQAALQSVPHYPRALAGLVRVELRKNERAAALQHAQLLARVRPNSATSQLLLGDAERRTGDLTSARAAYRRAVRLGSQEARTRLRNLPAR